MIKFHIESSDTCSEGDVQALTGRRPLDDGRGGIRLPGQQGPTYHGLMKARPGDDSWVIWHTMSTALN